MANTEEWRFIADLPGFEVSNKGNIRSWLRPGPNPTWYDEPHFVRLACTTRSPYLYFKHTNGQRSVHREVAKAFLPNPDGLQCVNHLDENKLNNNVENLQWCTHRENNAYSLGKPVRVFNPAGELVEFDSIADLARAIGANGGNVSRFVRGIRYKNGYKSWRMANE